MQKMRRDAGKFGRPASMGASAWRWWRYSMPVAGGMDGLQDSAAHVPHLRHQAGLRLPVRRLAADRDLDHRLLVSLPRSLPLRLSLHRRCGLPVVAIDDD